MRNIHERKQIREAVLGMLRTGLPGIQSFSANRFRSYWPSEELPAISIYTLSESSELFDQAPRRFKRKLQVVVEIVVQADEKADDELDDLCLAVEKTIDLDDLLGGTASYSQLSATEIIEKPEGDTMTASAILTYDVEYYNWAPDERTLPDFSGEDVSFSPIAAPPGTVDMKVEINVEGQT